LLELADRDEAAGLGDAPWPPHFKKMEGEGSRVAPSRAKKPAGAKKTTAKKAPRAKLPVITIANSPDKKAALAGLDRWKEAHPVVVSHLAPEDTLVDSMRGRSSTWTRIRINLQHVPEEIRPQQGTPDPDEDPTREWRELSSRAKRGKEFPPRSARGDG
jgi:bifunctional non-homologous end joining protein LigD